MTHACLRVGLAISWHMNHETGEAWPGANAIIKRSRVSRRTVRRCIEYLVRNNHVLAEKTAGRVTHYAPQPLADQCQSSGTSAKAMTPVPQLRHQTSAKAMTPDRCQSYGTRTSKEPLSEPLSGPSSLCSLNGSLARPKEEGGRARQEMAQGEKALEPIAKLSSLNASDQSGAVPSEPRSTIDELRVKLNMPDLGKSVRRMN